MARTRAAIAAAGFVLVACSGSTSGSVPTTQNASQTRIVSPVPGAGVLIPPGGSLPMPNEAVLSARASSVVWVLVARQYLYESTDGGVTWRQRPTPEGGPLEDISFIDARDGWAMRSGPAAGQCSFGADTVWSTTDAGATWSRLISVDPQHEMSGGVRFDQCKWNISFTDLTHGYLVAWDENGRPTIYHTEDGGVSWGASILADPPGFVTEGAGVTLRPDRVAGFGDTLLVDTSNAQTGLPRSFIYTSTDSGRTWSYLVPSLGEEVFVTATRWLRFNPNPGQSQETTDSGQNWHAFATDYGQAAPVAPQFVFGDPMTGYATVRGEIQRTTDGGAHWSYLKTPGT